MSRGARLFSLTRPPRRCMDDDARTELRQLREQFGKYRQRVRETLYGKRGDNGLFGRIQSLEESRKYRERREALLWMLVGSMISGLAIWTIQSLTGSG